MRLIKKLQQVLREAKVKFSRGDELEEIDKILEQAPGIKEVYEAVLRDVNGGRVSKVGQEGLSAEQIVKLGILRKRDNMSYRDLSDATADSLSIRKFLNIPIGKKLSKSAIQSNLKLVSDATWRKLNESLIRKAEDDGLEDGKTIRSDTTTTETNIHYPTDASLLADSIRVLTRIMGRAEEVDGVELDYTDHSRRSKKKLYKINNTRSQDKRRTHYLELIRIARATVVYAEKALVVLDANMGVSVEDYLLIRGYVNELKTYIPLAKQVIDQAYRRIVLEEKVPANEKIVSIFEPHTDIIEKGQRDTVFGHKISLTSGKSCLILKCTILDGNPADKTLVRDIITDHIESYGQAPEELALDGGFASAANRDRAKEMGVNEITFAKNLRMKIESLVSSPKVHKLLMNFRAGIEGCISFLKRIFGLDRILDRTKETFKSALQCAIVTYNLVHLARYNLAKAALAKS